MSKENKNITCQGICFRQVSLALKVKNLAGSLVKLMVQVTKVRTNEIQEYTDKSIG